MLQEQAKSVHSDWSGGRREIVQMGVSILQTSKAMDKIALQYSLDKKENIFTMHKICSPGIKVQFTV